MTISDWLMILAVLSGPIAAVQVQKLIEAWKEARTRKLTLFKTLMATRGTTLSPRHVEALNMIDLEFSTKNPKEKKVVDAWKIYHDHLNSLKIDANDPDYSVKMDTWNEKSNTLLIDLLSEMSKILNYDFDKVQLKRGSYFPQGHADIELEQRLIRRGVVDLFYRGRPIPVNLVQLPPEGTNQQQDQVTG